MLFYRKKTGERNRIMTQPVRWGILSAGKIAGHFAEDLKKTAGAQAAAVAARSKERADGFARKYGIDRSYGSYEELARDPGVDIVYIGTTHNFHMEHTLLCLGHGKHVLCEKPFALNAGQARRMIAAARDRKLFLMEAMWSRYNPVYRKAMRWVRMGAIGEIRMLKADFGFRCAWDPQGRLLNPELAGGSVLDVGVYPIALASHLFGAQPSKMHALAHLGKTGVDEQAAMLFKYAGGGLALLSSAVRTRTPANAFVIGTEGIVWMPRFWQAKFALMWRRRKLPKITIGQAGYRFEAAECGRCIRAAELESPEMTLGESLAIMETMDRVREKIGLQYPGE
jgi:predicted dehydrogenase